MPHVSPTAILKDARTRGYGIPNLWGGSIEQVLGHIAAAEDTGAPLFLCYNHGLCPQLPVEIGVPLIVTAARHAKTPVATMLDHGADFETAVKCIHHGVSGVMFDGSHLPYEENVQQTREIVRVAHLLGVSVESELGEVGGSAVETGGEASAQSVMTDPSQAADFVARTGVDALAISFGNVHGKYRGEPALDLDRVRQIAARVDIPLVMHGASGLSDDEYPPIIAAGISKVNYYTAMARTVAENLRRRMALAGDDLVAHKLIGWTIESYREETRKLLVLLGCLNKAAGLSA